MFSTPGPVHVLNVFSLYLYSKKNPLFRNHLIRIPILFELCVNFLMVFNS